MGQDIKKTENDFASKLMGRDVVKTELTNTASWSSL